jgi:hypothetical protein
VETPLIRFDGAARVNGNKRRQVNLFKLLDCLVKRPPLRGRLRPQRPER